MAPPEPAAASAFFAAHEAEIRAAAALGPVLDLACGSGRHVLALARGGTRVIGIDLDPGALRGVAAACRAEGLPGLAVRADLESSGEIPVRPGTCGAILVFRFLWRPLAPAIARSLRRGGLLVYETFTRRQRELPHGPRNPAFLLEDGELPRLFPTLRVLRHEEGLVGTERPEALARLLARSVG